MDSAELLAVFEADSFAPAQFSHEKHVQVAWLLADRYGNDEGLARLIVGIKAMAMRAGKPQAFHVTLTRAWFELIASVDDLDAAPELLDKSIIKRFYSAERIAEGREQWLEPDVHPLGLPLPEREDDEAASTL